MSAASWKVLTLSTSALREKSWVGLMSATPGGWEGRVGGWMGGELEGCWGEMRWA